MTDDPLGPAVRRRRRWVFRTSAVVLGLSPFVILELTLSALDVADPHEQADPFVGFSSVRPLFEHDERRGVYQVSPSRSLFFGRQEFPSEKPANGFRIFCLGGSTVRGRPYETDSAFAKWLELELQDRDPTRAYQAVNCGGLSYASYRLVHVLEEVLTHEPDLIVLATGHNEFLEDRSYAHVKSRSTARAWMEDRLYSLRTVSLVRQSLGALRSAPRTEARAGESSRAARTVLPDKVETTLDQRSGYASYHWDAQWRQAVVEHFGYSLRKMVGMCEQAGVPLVLVNLGMNLRDCPPFKSEHTETLSAADELRWRELFDQASLVEPGEPEAALRLYYEAEEISEGHALLCWRIARCLDRLGRTNAARPYYGRAKEFDVCPLRALDAITAIMNEVAAATSAPLVDARSLLESQSRDHIPGYDQYVDHVHPSPGGHQRIARAIAETLREHGLPERLPEWTAERSRFVYRRHWNELGPVFLADGARRIGWLENWAQRQRLFEETLPVSAAEFLRHGHKYIDLNDDTIAWEAYQAAVELDPDATAEIAGRAARLMAEGRPTAAERLLERLDELETDDARRAVIALGRLVAAVDRGDGAEAVRLYRAHSEEVAEALRSPSDWRSMMPDVLERAAALRDQSNPAPN